MIRAVFGLFITTLFLHAANLLDIKLEEAQNSFKILLVFDSAIDTMPVEKKEQNQIFVEFANSQISKPYIFSPNSVLLSSIRVNQNINKTIVHIVPKKELMISTSLQNNNKTVAVELSPQVGKKQTEELINNIKIGSENMNLEENYLYMLLFISLLLLVWIVIKIFAGSKDGSWLMGKGKIDNFEIIQQKVIDSKNKLIVVRFKGMNYILLVGQSALLIDNYEDGKELVGNSFDNLLKGSGAKLSDYLLDTKKR